MADPRTTTPTTRGDRTRASVLAAAATHLAEHGLEGLRGAQVAADAGVSEATVWFHFGTKQGLLIAAMESYYDELVAEIDDVVADGTSPVERLEAFARFWLERMSRDLPLVGEFGRQGRSGHDDDVVAAFAASNRRVTRGFERLVQDLTASGHLRSDLPTWLVRDTFFGTAEHLLIGRAVTGRATDLDATAQLLLTVLLEGVGGTTATGDDDRPTLATLDAKLDRLLERS